MKNKGINNTIFAFGTSNNVVNSGGGHFGYLVLLKNHTVLGYKHKNETFWKFDDNQQLCFLTHKKQVTSRYSYFAEKNCYIGTAEHGIQVMYLMPVFSFPELNYDAEVILPSVFINSIPKSGTHLINAALSKIGFTPADLMIIGENTVGDLRNLDDDNMFKYPWSTALKFPHELLLPMYNNNVIMGHIEFQHIIDNIKRNNINVITSIRDLRDVLLSLYKFKRDVFGLTLEESEWKKTTGTKHFKLFLETYHKKDLLHIRRIARMVIADKNKTVLRYENCIKGIVPKHVKNTINSWSPELGNKIEHALQSQINTKTATLSKVRSNWKTDWNNIFEEYYYNNDMDILNKQLGYE
jgi:hypothetical protein